MRRLVWLLPTLLACGQTPASLLDPSGSEPTPPPPGEAAPTTPPGEIDPAMPEPPGPPVTPPPPRLQARFVVAEEGGARRMLHFVDRETGTPCRLVDGDDDRDPTRVCVPAPTGGVFFLDSECTTPVVETTQPNPRWLTAWGSSEQAGPVRVGARISDGGQQLWLRGYGGDRECVEAPRRDAPLYTVEAFVGRDELPSGRVVAEDRNRMRIHRLETEDGVRAVLHIVDVASGVTCDPEGTEAGPRCAPKRGVIRDYGIRNADCSAVVVQEYASPGVAYVRGEDGPPLRFEALPDGDPIGYPTGDGGCRQEPGNYSRSRPYAGFPHPPEDWAPLALDEHGGRRIVARPGRFEDGESAERIDDIDPRAMFEDRRLATMCGPAWVAGTLRCVPEAAEETQSWVTVYADPECTRGAVAVDPRSPRPAFVTLRTDATVARDGDLPDAEVFEVQDQLEAAYYIDDSRGGCTQAGHRGDFYRLGGAMPADAFAALRLELE